MKPPITNTLYLSYDENQHTWGWGRITARVCPVDAPDKTFPADCSLEAKPNIFDFRMTSENGQITAIVTLKKGFVLPPDLKATITVIARQDNAIGTAMDVMSAGAMVPGLQGAVRSAMDLKTVIPVAFLPYAIRVLSKDPRRNVETEIGGKGRAPMVDIEADENGVREITADLVVVDVDAGGNGTKASTQAERWEKPTLGGPAAAAFACELPPGGNRGPILRFRIVSKQALSTMQKDAAAHIVLKATLKGGMQVVRNVPLHPDCVSVQFCKPGLPRMIQIVDKPMAFTLPVEVHSQSVEPCAGLLVRWQATSGLGSFTPASATTDAQGQARTLYTPPDTSVWNARTQAATGITFTAHIGNGDFPAAELTLPCENEEPCMWLCTIGKLKWAAFGPSCLTSHIAPERLQALARNGGVLTVRVFGKMTAGNKEFFVESVRHCEGWLQLEANRKFKGSTTSDGSVEFIIPPPGSDATSSDGAQPRDPKQAGPERETITLPQPLRPNVVIEKNLQLVYDRAAGIDARLLEPAAGFIQRCLNIMATESPDELKKRGEIFNRGILAASWFMDLNGRLDTKLTEAIEIRKSLLGMLLTSITDLVVDLAIGATFWAGGKAKGAFRKAGLEEAGKKLAGKPLAELAEASLKKGALPEAAERAAKELAECESSVQALARQIADLERLDGQVIDTVRGIYQRGPLAKKTAIRSLASGRGLNHQQARQAMQRFEEWSALMKQLDEALAASRSAHTIRFACEEQQKLLQNLAKAASDGNEDAVRKALVALEEPLKGDAPEFLKHAKDAQKKVVETMRQAINVVDENAYVDLIERIALEHPDLAGAIDMNQLKRVRSFLTQTAAAADEAKIIASTRGILLEMAAKPWLKNYVESCADGLREERRSYHEAALKAPPKTAHYVPDTVENVVLCGYKPYMCAPLETSGAHLVQSVDTLRHNAAPETGLASDTQQLAYSQEVTLIGHCLNTLGYLVSTLFEYAADCALQLADYVQSLGLSSTVIQGGYRELGLQRLAKFGLKEGCLSFRADGPDKIREVLASKDNEDTASVGARERIQSESKEWAERRSADQTRIAKDALVILCTDALRADRLDSASLEAVTKNQHHFFAHAQHFVSRITTNLGKYKAAAASKDSLPDIVVKLMEDSWETISNCRWEISWTTIESLFYWIGWSAGWLVRILGALSLAATPIAPPAGIAGFLLFKLGDDIIDGVTHLGRVILGSVGSIRDVNGLIEDILIADGIVSDAYFPDEPAARKLPIDESGRMEIWTQKRVACQSEAWIP